MENSEQQLKNLKRKVLDKKNKIEAMIFELREMNETLNNFPKEKDYTSYFEELNNSILRLTSEINKIKLEKVEVTNIKEAKTEQVNIPEYPTEMRISNLDDIPKTELKVEEKIFEFPKEFKISNLDEINFPEVKTEKVEVNIPKEFKISNLDELKQPTIETQEIKFPEKLNIDWENSPKPEKQKLVDINSPLNKLFKNIKDFLQIFFDKTYILFNNIQEYIQEPTRVTVTKKQVTEFYGNRKVTYNIKETEDKLEIIREK